MIAKNTVHLIDDDPAILASVAGFLETRGFSVRTYNGPVDFLAAIGSDPTGCVVSDMRMPVMSGLELAAKMHELGFALPVIFITAYADGPLSVEASKRDAVDILEKPFNNAALVKAIRKALLMCDEDEVEESLPGQLQARFTSLTDEERKVMGLLVRAKSNKSAAQELGVSVRLLERQRATIMLKMQAASTAELVKMWSNLGSRTDSASGSPGD